MKNTSIGCSCIIASYIAGCAIVPSGSGCEKVSFPSYYECYRNEKATPNLYYDDIIKYGARLATDVISKKISNDEAFIYFEEKKQFVQNQIVEIQSKAISSAIRRSSADPK